MLSFAEGQKFVAFLGDWQKDRKKTNFKLLCGSNQKNEIRKIIICDLSNYTRAQHLS